MRLCEENTKSNPQHGERTSAESTGVGNAGRPVSSSNAITPSAHASAAGSVACCASPAACAATTSGAA